MILFLSSGVYSPVPWICHWLLRPTWAVSLTIPFVLFQLMIKTVSKFQVSIIWWASFHQTLGCMDGCIYFLSQCYYQSVLPGCRSNVKESSWFYIFFTIVFGAIEIQPTLSSLTKDYPNPNKNPNPNVSKQDLNASLAAVCKSVGCNPQLCLVFLYLPYVYQFLIFF